MCRGSVEKHWPSLTKVNLATSKQLGMTAALVFFLRLRGGCVSSSRQTNWSLGKWGVKNIRKKGERGKSSQSSWPTFFKQNKKLSISQIPSKVMSSDLQFGLIVWSGHLNNECKNYILMGCGNADPKGLMKENPRRYVSQAGVSQISITCVVALLRLH